MIDVVARTEPEATDASETRAVRSATAWVVWRCSWLVAIVLTGDVLPGFTRTPLLVTRGFEQRPPAASAADVAAEIRSSLVRIAESAPNDTARREHAELVRLYAYSAHAPLWVDSTRRPMRRADEAIAVLNEAAADGLDPGAYHCGELARQGWLLRSAPPPSARDVAAFDLALSRTLLQYFRHLHLGRVDPRAVGYRLTVPEDGHDFVALLHAAVAGDRIRETAAGLAPPLAQYRGLRTMLARYRALTGPDVSDTMPPIGVLHPGEIHTGLAALHRQLVIYGDLDAGTPVPAATDAFEGPMVDAVKRFQVRHGLEPDGVVGVRTEAALRVRLTTRIRQIELALERLRWLPDVGDRRLIALNIPMFHLWAWDSIPPSGGPAFGMRAIVGRALRTQTPVFVQEMRSVVFRPYWNVPRSIVRNEILPLLASDPDYLQRHEMEMVRGGGDDASPARDTPGNRALLRDGTLRLRQRPGPRNALGLVKFVFPNDADVYMHGTPAQELFGRSRRDFSHGCVRVEDPVSLATWVLQSEPDWNRERILQAMAGPISQRVFLSRPIQVILFYSTAAFMPETGTMHFAEDIYRHDTRLDQALAAQ